MFCHIGAEDSIWSMVDCLLICEQCEKRSARKLANFEEDVENQVCVRDNALGFPVREAHMEVWRALAKGREEEPSSGVAAEESADATESVADVATCSLT